VKTTVRHLRVRTCFANSTTPLLSHLRLLLLRARNGLEPAAPLCDLLCFATRVFAFCRSRVGRACLRDVYFERTWDAFWLLAFTLRATV